MEEENHGHKEMPLYIKIVALIMMALGIAALLFCIFIIFLPGAWEWGEWGPPGVTSIPVFIFGYVVFRGGMIMYRGGLK